MNLSSIFLSPAKASQKHIVILGTGTAGLTFASQALRKLKNINITLIDKAQTHTYQPGLTLQGANLFPPSLLHRPTHTLIPNNAKWIQENAVHIDPNENEVFTESGKKIHYDALILACGIQLEYQEIPGFDTHYSSASNNAIASIYDVNKAPYVFAKAQKVPLGGRAIFTQPDTPIKCGGAPQKIMYLLDEYWKSQNKKMKIDFLLPQSVIFSCPYFAAPLAKLCEKRGIHVGYTTKLKEIKSPNEAVFVNTVSGEEMTEEFDFLHVVPPMRPPKVIRENTLLVDSNGYVNVDKLSMRHIYYKNVFSLGDCSNLPTSKTAAAIASEVPVLVKNVKEWLEGREDCSGKYDGYSSCPIVTGEGKLILAEFDYSMQPRPSFPFLDQRKEWRAFYWMKRYLFPFVYWRYFLKGTWYGKNGFIPPKV